MTEPNETRTHLDYARQHASVGTELAPGARFRLAKKLLLRAAHLITAEQAEFNHAVIEVLDEMGTRLGAMEAEVRDLKRATLALQASLASTEVRLEAIPEVNQSTGENPAGSRPAPEDQALPR
jgi:hypothetical protein